MKKFFAIALLLALGVSLSSIKPLPASAEAERNLSQRDQRLLELASKNRGVPVEDLEVLNSSDVRLPLTEQVVSTAKVRGRSTDEVFSVSMDANGNEVDLAALRRAEEGKYIAKYRKLDPFLHDVVQSRGGQEKVKVAFWLKLKDDLDGQDSRDGNPYLTDQEVENLIAQREEQLRKAVANATGPLKSVLRRQGFPIDEADTAAPIVYATIPVKALSALSERADVQRVYFADNKHEDYLDVAPQAIYADYVWNWYGYTGSDVRVAIVEDSRVDFDNNCLAVNLGTRVPGDANVDQHATTTAGMVASNNATYRGVAYGAGIY
ncbi:MAG: hypothetical protein LC672_01485, partial [Acidobacteria bacterium]|nr:hypothetical protein [Acidobacteriota bacterium]